MAAAAGNKKVGILMKDDLERIAEAEEYWADKIEETETRRRQMIEVVVWMVCGFGAVSFLIFVLGFMWMLFKKSSN